LSGDAAWILPMMLAASLLLFFLDKQCGDIYVMHGSQRFCLRHENVQEKDNRAQCSLRFTSLVRRSG
jgi:hypothetical protein